jgi:hypothetical protein
MVFSFGSMRPEDASEMRLRKAGLIQTDDHQPEASK